MNALVVGIALVAGACALLAQALLGDTSPRVPKGRRTGTATPSDPLWKVLYRSAVAIVDRLVRSRGWVPFRRAELEAADIRTPVSVLLTWIVGGTIVGFVLGFVLGQSLVRGLVLAALVPVGTKLVMRRRASRRRKAFAKELDNSLRIIASALRAGQSLPMALASVAADSHGPMGEEITRIINENRIGRDLVEAMMEAADRVGSEDFAWFAGAVEVQRDAGGNLNDIIDTVAETIRERSEIRGKIKAYAAEGKASAYVLMALPVALAVTYSLMNPGYLDPLFTTVVGNLLLAVSAVLYVVAFFWMRAIVDIKV